MAISEFTVKSGDAEPVRRFEVFTGAGRRQHTKQINVVPFSFGPLYCKIASTAPLDTSIHKCWNIEKEPCFRVFRRQILLSDKVADAVDERTKPQDA